MPFEALPLTISLGILCFLLFLLIILISGKNIKNACVRFCEKRNVTQPTEILGNTVIGRLPDAVPPGVTPVPGMTLSGQEAVAPQTILPKSRFTEKAPLYASVSKKTKKSDPDNVSTYVGTDGTEYQEVGNFTRDDEWTDKLPPPLVRSRTFEMATYASIDHNLAVPPNKTKGKK